MAQLILRDSNGQEIGRRPMLSDERYALYAAYSAGELLTIGQTRYRLHTVAWRVPEEECVVSVTFDSYAPIEPFVDE